STAIYSPPQSDTIRHSRVPSSRKNDSPTNVKYYNTNHNISNDIKNNIPIRRHTNSTIKHEEHSSQTTMVSRGLQTDLNSFPTDQHVRNRSNENMFNMTPSNVYYYGMQPTSK
ncbi:unnamed protein product, partial [Didymodactylos carnosus]